MPFSALALLGGETMRMCDGVFLTLLLRDRMSGSVVVSGGLGGPAPAEVYRRSGVPFRLFSLPKSVGSGVYKDSRGFTRSSRLPTASLLNFLENDG